MVLLLHGEERHGGVEEDVHRYQSLNKESEGRRSGQEVEEYPMTQSFETLSLQPADFA